MVPQDALGPPARVKERTVYYSDGTEFASVARFGPPLVKLVATEWDDTCTAGMS